jgi:hypothetical protein
MISSLARRDAIPASARNFCSRTIKQKDGSKAVSKQNQNAGLSFALGLAQTGHPVPFLPLAALLQKFHTLKTLQHISLCAETARSS